jgi:hypothetical protein
VVVGFRTRTNEYIESSRYFDTHRTESVKDLSIPYDIVFSIYTRLSLRRKSYLPIYFTIKKRKLDAMFFHAGDAPLFVIAFVLTSLVSTLQLRRWKTNANSAILRYVSTGRDNSKTSNNNIGGLDKLHSSDTTSTATTTKKYEVQQQRLKHFMKCVSISYANSGGLMIMQGKGSRLMDETGRSYLDTRNNVCHVGHCHPRVVKAVSRQLAMLNTNTRYLHPNVCKLAERLCAKCPESLQVVVFVNSGSVRCIWNESCT